MQKIYTIDETAKLLRKSRMQIYRLREQGKLECYQDGKAVTFAASHIEKYLKAITRKSTARGFEYQLLKDWETLAGMTEAEKQESDKEMFALY